MTDDLSLMPVAIALGFTAKTSKQKDEVGRRQSHADEPPGHSHAQTVGTARRVGCRQTKGGVQSRAQKVRPVSGHGRGQNADDKGAGGQEGGEILLPAEKIKS